MVDSKWELTGAADNFFPGICVDGGFSVEIIEVIVTIFTGSN